MKIYILLSVTIFTLLAVFKKIDKTQVEPKVNDVFRTGPIGIKIKFYRCIIACIPSIKFDPNLFRGFGIETFREMDLRTDMTSSVYSKPN
jgi:hypothetical protein